MELSPQSSQHTHGSIDVGRDTYVLTGDGAALRFTSIEKKFLLALDKTHDVQAAVKFIGKPLEWAEAFFKRPKIRQWMSKVAQEESARQGMTIRWLRAQLLAIYIGREVWWEGECSRCHTHQKTWIEPDDAKGVLSAECLACQAPVLMNQIERRFEKSRTQMQALQELANRIDPKIERIQVEATDDQFIFKTQEDL